MNTFWSMFESALAQSLLGALWQDALLAALAALVLAAMARRSANARHAVGLLFLLAMLAAPAWQLVQCLQAPVMGELLDGERASGGDGTLWSTASLLPWAIAGATPGQAPAWLAWAWCGGVVVMLVRLGGGWWWLRTLERQPSPALVPLSWQRRTERLRQALGITRPVALRLLPGAALPFTARAWRPIIWLPLTMLTKLAPEQIEALIAHELAHIRRLDWVWNGLQCAIESLLFFHPGVWWLSRRVRIEREHACDDLAAAACGDALVVAEALAALETLRGSVPRLVLAAGGGSLQQRVVHLLAAGHPAGPRWGVAAGLLALLCAGGVWAAQASSAVPAVPTQPSATVATEDPWWTQVGDSMRIRIDDHGHLRDYHAWLSPTGERHETYRVDGRPAVIDAAVRQWVTKHHVTPPPSSLVPPEPPVPDEPGEDDGSEASSQSWLPPLPPLPPAPPMPPKPPSITKWPAYKMLLQAVQQDAAAARLLGTPITLSDDCDPCKLDDHSALLTLSARGPEGRATLQAYVRLVGDQWQVQTLDVQRSLAQRLGLSN